MDWFRTQHCWKGSSKRNGLIVDGFRFRGTRCNVGLVSTETDGLHHWTGSDCEGRPALKDEFRRCGTVCFWLVLTDRDGLNCWSVAKLVPTEQAGVNYWFIPDCEGCSALLDWIRLRETVCIVGLVSIEWNGLHSWTGFNWEDWCPPTREVCLVSLALCTELFFCNEWWRPSINDIS